jgi:threonine synthase
VPRAIGDFLILRAVRESGGTALAVSDRAMVDGMLAIGKCEGVSAAPEGGAALAAIQRLVADGTIKTHESVVLFNTGGALKYLDVLAV